MERKTVISLISFSVIIIILLFCFDFNLYSSKSKTISYDENGIIFSITAFDGDNESEPFVQCLGHAWVSVDNRSGHSIYIKNSEIKNNEIIAFSVWALSGHRGVAFNLEPAFISNYDRYVGRQSLSMNINESQLAEIEDYIDRNDNWTFGKNCSYWSIQLWNELADDDYKLKTPVFICTPKKVQKALHEFDCVETDKDFSKAGGVFFYLNENRTELSLCS